MQKHVNWNSIVLMMSLMLLGGCASTVFPDFEDDNEIIVSDGGKVEIREIDENGILIGDKENALYEDDEYAEPVIKTVEEKVEPAKVVAVKAQDIEPLVNKAEKADEELTANKKAKPVKSMSDDADDVPAEPSMQYLAATLHFGNGGAVVDASYNKELRKIADVVKKNNAKVLVFGFASSRTRDTDPASHKLANFKVSLQRAENTAKALRRFGVPADKIVTQALSDTMPMYQEIMPEGERLNRRAEIYLVY